MVPKQNHEIHWRKSLVPAPAVIPAPIAYIIDVAVETFVVELCLLGYCGVYDIAMLSAESVQQVLRTFRVLILGASYFE